MAFTIPMTVRGSHLPEYHGVRVQSSAMSGPRVKACLNGGRGRDEHPAVPITPDELATEAAEAVAAGAFALHLHPRDDEGRETLEGAHVEAALAAVRAACPGVPVGVGTGLWIAGGNPRRREDLVAGWGALRERPDYASVNLSEKGARRLAAALRRAGIGVEAGVWTEDDVATLLRGTLGSPLARVLVEPQDSDPLEAQRTAAAIDRALDAAEVEDERFHHGYGPATWDVIRVAATRGRSVRAGLEDTTTLPDGTRARGNADLVAAAVEMLGA